MFVKGEAHHPKLKKKRWQWESFYAPRIMRGLVIRPTSDKIHTLRWVRLKEFGYIPLGADITGGKIAHGADRFLRA